MGKLDGLFQPFYGDIPIAHQKPIAPAPVTFPKGNGSGKDLLSQLLPTLLASRDREASDKRKFGYDVELQSMKEKQFDPHKDPKWLTLYAQHQMAGENYLRLLREISATPAQLDTAKRMFDAATKNLKGYSGAGIQIGEKTVPGTGIRGILEVFGLPEQTITTFENYSNSPMQSGAKSQVDSILRTAPLSVRLVITEAIRSEASPTKILQLEQVMPYVGK